MVRLQCVMRRAAKQVKRHKLRYWNTDTPVSPSTTCWRKWINSQDRRFSGALWTTRFLPIYILRYGFAPAKIFYLATKAFAQSRAIPVSKKWLKVFLKRFFTTIQALLVPIDQKLVASISPRGEKFGRTTSNTHQNCGLTTAINKRTQIWVLFYDNVWLRGCLSNTSARKKST